MPGIIVAGGAATRLGGGAKALRLVGGRPVLAHLVERLAPQCDPLLLNTNRDDLAGFTLPRVADHPEDAGCGPLAGVLAGLDWVAANRPDALLALTAPGDTPFLPLDLVDRLHAARRREGAVLAAARSGARVHPLAALWPVDLRHALRPMLRTDGIRRLGTAMVQWPIAWVEWPHQPLDPFFNVNTPADLAEADALAALA